MLLTSELNATKVLDNRHAVVMETGGSYQHHINAIWLWRTN